ncbi:MAG: YciI family protein [Candidatus Dormibacteria bacterium]
MPQYLLSVHSVEGQPVPSAEVMKQMYADVDAINDEIRSAGAWVFAGGLEDHASATVVSVKEGNVVVTDGPFIEGKEHIGGFWILECADLDEALAWARKATVACRGAVEVRPFQEEPQL